MNFSQKLVGSINILITALLLSMPFYAFLTIFSSSIIGHYTAVRLYGEAILLVLAIGSILLIIIDSKLRKLFFDSTLIKLIALFAIIVIVWGLVSYWKKDVSAKAFGYGIIVDLRFLLFFVVTLIYSLKNKITDKKIIKIILVPSLIVIIFALFQAFILPNNFLSHFGYNSRTILPYETINANKNYVRIIATLRGANPLGAYLIIPISLLAVLFYKLKNKYLVLFLLLMAFIALFFSFSRSAWIGSLLAVYVIFYYKLPSMIWKKRMIYVTLAIIVLFLGSLIFFRNNAKFQNIFFHTQSHSKSVESSNAGHVSALESGLSQLASNPLGRGPGTAGPASVYNKYAQPRIAENFYIQIGQELGWVGFVVFILIQLIIGRELFSAKDNDLSLVLLASFIGIFFVNMLSHAWADDTLAYVWWGMAGLIFGQTIIKKHNKKSSNRLKI